MKWKPENYLPTEIDLHPETMIEKKPEIEWQPEKE